MLTWIREKFGKTMIGGIVALLSAVFVFYGVFTPKTDRGGPLAGEVNGEGITLSEFNKAYNRQLEFFKNMMGGGNLSDDQLKNFHVRESVFQDLARRKIIVQEALKEGYLPSEEELRDHIAEMDVFKSNGHFDLDRYKAVLAQNEYSPAGFEKLLRDDLAVEKLQDYFRSRVNVSDAEIQQQFLATGEKRNIKYVLLTNEAGKKDVKVDPTEVQKYLTDPAKLNLVKNQYEMKKSTEFKGKDFDSVKAQITKDVIASSRLDEIRKANDQIASRVLPLMSADKGSDARVNAALKTYGITVKSTGLVGRDAQYLPGIGEARDLMTDAFADKSPISGKVKRYNSVNWVLLAVVTDSQKADSTRFATERDNLARQTIAKKEHALFEAWLQEAVKRAKIKKNPAVAGEQEEG